MVQDLIRYDLLIKSAMQKVVGKVLSDIAKDGLPGDHHFFITFKTDAPGVRLSSRIRERYPREMTIALQHQFWDLIVTDHYFEVGLSFSGATEHLTIPFDAMTVFYDPSVQFALSFQPQRPEGEEGEDDDTVPENDTVADLSSRGRNETATAKRTSVPAAKRQAGKSDQTAKPDETDAKAAAKDKAAKPAAKAKDKKKDAETEEASDTAENGAQIVQLDAFRKKP